MAEMTATGEATVRCGHIGGQTAAAYIDATFDLTSRFTPPPLPPSAEDQALFEMLLQGVTWKSDPPTDAVVFTGCHVTAANPVQTPVVDPAPADVDKPDADHETQVIRAGSP